MIGTPTISKNNAPTQSSPSPSSKISPNASCRRSVNILENSANSAMFPKIIRTSSFVIGGGQPPEPEDDSEDVEIVRIEEPDDLGGVAGLGK